MAKNIVIVLLILAGAVLVYFGFFRLTKINKVESCQRSGKEPNKNPRPTMNQGPAARPCLPVGRYGIFEGRIYIFDKK